MAKKKQPDMNEAPFDEDGVVEFVEDEELDKQGAIQKGFADKANLHVFCSWAEVKWYNIWMYEPLAAYMKKRSAMRKEQIPEEQILEQIGNPPPIPENYDGSQNIKTKGKKAALSAMFKAVDQVTGEPVNEPVVSVFVELPVVHGSHKVYDYKMTKRAYESFSEFMEAIFADESNPEFYVPKRTAIIANNKGKEQTKALVAASRQRRKLAYMLWEQKGKILSQNKVEAFCTVSHSSRGDETKIYFNKWRASEEPHNLTPPDQMLIDFIGNEAQ